MTSQVGARILPGAANAAAVPAPTFHAVANNAHGVYPRVAIVVVNANGANPCGVKHNATDLTPDAAAA